MLFRYSFHIQHSTGIVPNIPLLPGAIPVITSYSTAKLCRINLILGDTLKFFFYEHVGRYNEDDLPSLFYCYFLEPNCKLLSVNILRLFC